MFFPFNVEKVIIALLEKISIRRKTTSPLKLLFGKRLVIECGALKDLLILTMMYLVGYREKKLKK
ncbi:MAG: hypothetical protein EBT26_09205 [Microbacteriaceae bacterium]|nr:hypothetical protein [Microbacteriaceae bacterium]